MSSEVFGRAWERFRQGEQPDSRGRTLFELIPCFSSHDRRPRYAEVLAIAGEVGDERARSRYLRDTFGSPLLDPHMERARGRAAEMGRHIADPVARACLLKAFDYGGSAAKQIFMLDSQALSPVDRVEILKDACSLLAGPEVASMVVGAMNTIQESDLKLEVARAVAAQVPEAHVSVIAEIANSSADDLVRNQIVSSLEASFDIERAARSRSERMLRNEGVADPEVRAYCQMTALSFLGQPHENEHVAGKVLDAVSEVPDADVRIDLLGRYLRRVPGGSPWRLQQVLEIARAVDNERARGRALATLAGVVDPGEVLAEAARLGEPTGRAIVLFAYGPGYDPLGKSVKTWDANLFRAAKQVTQASIRTRFMTRLALHNSHPDAAKAAWSGAIEIQDGWLQAQALDRLSLLAPVPVPMLNAAIASLENSFLSRRVRGIARLARHFPQADGDELRQHVLEELLVDAEPSELPSLVRRVVQDGQMESWRWEGDAW